MLTLGQRLKALRRARGFTQAQLGARFGLAESTVSLYEADKRNPDYTILKEMASFFQVSLDYLLNQTADLQPTPLVRESTPPYGKEPLLSPAPPNTIVVLEKDLRSGAVVLQELPDFFWFKVEDAHSAEEGILPQDLVLINRTVLPGKGDLGLALVSLEAESSLQIRWLRYNPELCPSGQKETLLGLAMELHRIYRGVR